MERYAIYAYEAMNNGSKRHYKRLVIEANDYFDAVDAAEQMSLEVMESSGVGDYLYSEAISEYEFDHRNDDDDDDEMDTDVIDEIYYELCKDNMAYTIWSINEDVAANYSTDDLNIKFSNNSNDFIKRFCTEEKDALV